MTMAAPLPSRNSVVGMALATAPATAGQRRVALVLCLLFTIVTVALLPSASYVHAPIPGFVAIYQTTIIIAYSLTAYLLFSHFLRTRVISLLWVGAGAFYTAAILVLQLMSFPNILASGRLFGGSPDTTSWLWTFWHIGPPLFALGYAIEEHRHAGRRCAANQSWLLVLVVLVSIGALIALTAGIVGPLVSQLPVIVKGDDYWQLTTSGVGPAVEVLTVVALAVLWSSTRGRTVLHLWLAVSLFTLFLDNGLTMLGAARGSLGWTVGRLEALISASFLVLVYLREIGVLHDRLAERTQALEIAIEEKLQAQAALQQAQKMEAIGQLTGGVAHDFNNLLTAVIGNLDLLRRHIAEPKPLRLLENATRAAERGGVLTEQLLAFSRKQHLVLKPTDLNSLVDGMSDLLQRTIGPAIRIAVVPASQLWPATVDPNQIEMAVLNLAINARDAMAIGGTITIETSNLPSGHPDIPPDAPAGDYVLLSVADTGTGMSPEVLSRAFEPFFSTKDVGRGSGLGLSMVDGVTRQSGGAVSIETGVGCGTTVRMFLRRAEKPASSADSPRRLSLGPVTSTGTILLVDDDRDVRTFSATCLTELGYQVAQAASGRVALAMLENGQEADLLVLDFAMPGLNGAEVAARVRDLRPDLPILFITGYADTDVLKQASADEFILKKPFLPVDLADRVASILKDAPTSWNVVSLRSATAKS